MAGRLRSLSSREVLHALRHFGFEVVAVRGSHARLQRLTTAGDTQTLTIPLHKTLARGTVRAIFRQASRYVPEDDLTPWFFTD